MTWTIAVAALSALLLSAAGALVTEVGPWYRSLRKPSFQPPDWAFGPAWTVILGLAAWSGVLAWEAAPDAAARTRVAIVFAVNAALHFTWSPLFFKLRRPDWAFIEVTFLWGSVLALVIVLWEFSMIASLLVVPYLVWVTFAALINLEVVRLNKPFGR